MENNLNIFENNNCEENNLSLGNNALKARIEDTSSESDYEEIIKIINEQSDEEEILLEAIITLNGEKRNSINNYLEEVVSKYTEQEFRMHFRVSRLLYLNLVNRFKETTEYKNSRLGVCITAEKTMAVFLWFAGHEACSYRDLSDRFNISISTVSYIIDKASSFISNLSPEVITWPNEQKKKESANYFKNESGFSKAIGCIDGTHIFIDPPSDSKDEYIDRKGNVTLCMQGVCDENRKFINVYIGFPGSCHDSWVLKNSPLFQKMPTACGDYYLLGDSAYPCSQYIITP